MVFNVNEANLILDTIVLDLDNFSARIENYKEEELAGDLFSQIDFLSQLDETRGSIFSKLSLLEKTLSDLKLLKSEHLFQEQLQDFNLLRKSILQVLEQVKPKLKATEDSYSTTAEDVLRRSQDKIGELTDKILEHRNGRGSLKREVDLELDEENELHELRDSLEMYREIRLESVLEENGDPIINQLDSQIVTCDSALLIDESSL